MSTMDRYTYYNIIVMLLTVRYIQGQTYSLSGSASYGIRGGDYRFTCRISVDNIPQGVSFNIGNDIICRVLLLTCQESSSDTRYTCGCINGNNRTLYLNITNVQSTDAGTWTCRDGSVGSPPVTLPVYYPPTIKSLTSDANNNMIDEDSTVTFTCSVDSLPSSVISWSRSQQGGQLYSGSQYTIPKARCQHTDNYTCTASNNIGQPVSNTIPLYVRCAPVLDPNQETKTTISIGRGETGALSIHVLAYPLPVYTWYYQLQDGSKQLITDFRIRQEDDGLSSTLTIQDVTEDDGGKYIVYVNNSAGTKSTVFNLVVSSQDGDNDDVISRERGIGAAICLAVCFLVLGIATVSLWCIMKKRGQRICFQNIKDQTVANDTTNRTDNVTLSDIPPIPTVYDRVDATNTRDAVNLDYINTSTTASPYEVLDKQTMDTNTYQQLSPYQNLHV
ncbi:lachesin isoform X2 [Patella vulgata]|uniref:lachesin isoform X2 n=1 Tax=Patella vulgata TaxID=6465 RepID=UPI0024A83544|nr:lachesin isoform X2 [Patella vulgata]